MIEVEWRLRERGVTAATPPKHDETVSGHWSSATAPHPTGVRHAPRALIVLARECERLRVVLSNA